MYDAHAQHTLLPASPQILRHDGVNVSRGEGVEVQDAIDRVPNRLVHASGAIGRTASLLQRKIGANRVEITHVEIRILPGGESTENHDLHGVALRQAANDILPDDPV